MNREDFVRRARIGPPLAGEVVHELDLTEADLAGADLRGVRLLYSKLDRANLRGADLSGHGEPHSGEHSPTRTNEKQPRDEKRLVVVLLDCAVCCNKSSVQTLLRFGYPMLAVIGDAQKG